MLVSGSDSAANCLLRLSQRRRSTHANCDYDCQGTASHLPHLLCPPRHRHGSRARRELPHAADEVVDVRSAPQSPERCAAVHRLPPELLGIIFENCVDEEAHSSAVLSEAPLLLGRVCSYWRSVSQNTSRLWTSLSLQFLETDVDRLRDGLKVASTVETWLHRSLPAPLSIVFSDERIFQKDTEGVVVWLLSHIRMNAHRWKNIHLKFSSDYFIHLSVLSSCAFTSLTSFSAHIDHMGWRRSLHSLRLDLVEASRLTSLAYTGPHHVMKEDIFVDWGRLTSLAFSYDLHEAAGESASLSWHFLKLALCRNLTELCIGLSPALAQHMYQLDAIAQGQTMVPMIELPRLHTLRVRRLSRSAHACALLDALRLPQLSTLHIDSTALLSWDSLYMPSTHSDAHPPLLQIHTQAHWWHARHFSALLDRSGCHLRTLHILDVDMSSPELARLLMSPRTSSTLSTFTFKPCQKTYSVLDVLAHLVPVPSSECTPAASPNPSPISAPGRWLLSFPSLTQLSLSCAHESHLDLIADLIESRTGDRAVQAGVRSLSAFELVFYDFVYNRGQGKQPRRKACFDAFRERVLRCARENGVDMDIRVDRPYEPVYLSAPTS